MIPFGSLNISPIEGVTVFSTIRKPALLRIYLLPLVLILATNMTGSIDILYSLDLGANVFQVNLINTIQRTMSILFLVPFGFLSDRFGRKPMLLLSRSLIIVGTIIRVVASNPDHLIIAAFTGGFAGGGFFPLILSMLADVAEPDELHEAISTMYIFSSIGMLIGPTISSSLLTLPQVSLRNLYQINAILQLGLLVYIVAQIGETRPESSNNEKGNLSVHLSELMHQRNFQNLLVLGCLYFFSMAIINTYIPIFARMDLNLTDSEIASFSIFRSLAILAIRVLSATMLAKLPIKPFLTSVIVLGGITRFVSPLANDYPALVMVLFASGISYGATAILGNTLVAMNSARENRGAANSLYNLSSSLGSIMLIFTTSLAETQGLTPVFIIGGIAAFMSILPMFIPRKQG